MKLTINEKEYPLHWGLGAIEMFCDTLDCEIADLDKAFLEGRDRIKYLVTLIHCALKNGSEIENYFDDFEVSYRQLQKFLDDAPEETLTLIIDDFKKSKYMGKTVANYLFGEVENSTEEATTSKKKLPSEE